MFSTCLLPNLLESDPNPLLSERQMQEVASKSAQKTHGYFLSQGPIVYENETTTTTVTRLPTQEPYTPSIATHSSVQAMLEAEVNRRKSTSFHTRGGYAPKIEHTAFSYIPREDFVGEIATQEGRTVAVRNEYLHHSNLNWQTYMGEDHQVHVVHHAVSSSFDRSSTDIPMARVLRDHQTDESIFYGGRPDSLERAQFQALDIFRSEFTRDVQKPGKGIRCIGYKHGKPMFEMTYLVDSLTNLGTLTNPKHMCERDSMERQRDALGKFRDRNAVYKLHEDVDGVDGFIAGLTLKGIKLRLARIYQLWKKRRQIQQHYPKGQKLRLRRLPLYRISWN